jgi:hypothetical protein
MDYCNQKPVAILGGSGGPQQAIKARDNTPTDDVLRGMGMVIDRLSNIDGRLSVVLDRYRGPVPMPPEAASKDAAYSGFLGEAAQRLAVLDRLLEVLGAKVSNLEEVI